MAFCPCGNKEEYALCCGKFIDHTNLPSTPEELMRSRYTAYTKGRIDYIEATQKDKAAEAFNPEETRRWAKRAKWLDLSILKAPPHSNQQGFVEFLARYSSSNKVHQIHERSEFQCVDGHWYYVASHHPEGCGCH